MIPLAKLVLLTGTLLLTAWLVGLGAYTSAMPQTLQDKTTQTDAIVVLTGGSERLEVGLALLERGLAQQLFLSGVGGEVTLDDLRETALDVPDHLIDRVTLGHAALDTVGNARETADWMKTMGFKSLRLVTAAYHMPRALLELHAAMPEIQIIPNPVFPKTVKQTEWWKWRGTALLMAEEYTKFLVAWLRAKVIRLSKHLPGINSEQNSS